MMLILAQPDFALPFAKSSHERENTCVLFATGTFPSLKQVDRSLARSGGFLKAIQSVWIRAGNWNHALPNLRIHEMEERQNKRPRRI